MWNSVCERGFDGKSAVREGVRESFNRDGAVDSTIASLRNGAYGYGLRALPGTHYGAYSR